MSTTEEQPKGQLRLILEYLPDQQAKFVRLYDKEYFQMQGPWLFPPGLVAGRSPEQLKELFLLPFTPKYICDATVEPDNKIFAYATPDSKKQNIYYAETGLNFFNERAL